MGVCCQYHGCQTCSYWLWEKAQEYNKPPSYSALQQNKNTFVLFCSFLPVLKYGQHFKSFCLHIQEVRGFIIRVSATLSECVLALQCLLTLSRWCPHTHWAFGIRIILSWCVIYGGPNRFLHIQKELGDRDLVPVIHRDFYRGDQDWGHREQSEWKGQSSA